MASAYLGLGSNLGDRMAMLRAAASAIGELPGVSIPTGGIASVYETAPVGGPPDQAPYFNTAVRIRTEIEPIELLDAVLRIEAELGRVRTGAARWAARPIDIDVLLHSDTICECGRLTLPHPRLHERLFVLLPLAEVAADVMHPVLKQTFGHLARRARNDANPGAATRIADSCCTS